MERPRPRPTSPKSFGPKVKAPRPSVKPTTDEDAGTAPPFTETARTKKRRNQTRTGNRKAEASRPSKPEPSGDEKISNRSPRRYSRVTDKKLNAFLDALIQHAGHIGIACEVAGIKRENIFQYRYKHPEFEMAYQDALDKGQKDIKAVLRKGRDQLLKEGMEELLNQPPHKRDSREVALYTSKINDTLGVNKPHIETNVHNSNDSPLYKDVKINVVKPDTVVKKIKAKEKEEKERLDRIREMGTQEGNDDEDYYD